MYRCALNTHRFILSALIYNLPFSYISELPLIVTVEEIKVTFKTEQAQAIALRIFPNGH